MVAVSLKGERPMNELIAHSPCEVRTKILVMPKREPPNQAGSIGSRPQSEKHYSFRATVILIAMVNAAVIGAVWGMHHFWLWLLR